MGPKKPLITFIDPMNPEPNLADQVFMPMYGMPLLATIVRDRGYDVEVFIERLAQIDWDRISRSDMVCFTLLSSSWPRFLKLASRIRERGPTPIVMGGTFATYMADRILEAFDSAIIVKGEGDETLPELIEGLLEGRDLGEIKGIAYVSEGNVVHTPDRTPVSSFETIPDYSLVRGYESLLKKSSWAGFRNRLTPVSTLQTSRGCPYKCSFCVVKRMFGTKYRTRSIDGVIEDLRRRHHQGTLFFIVDNHFTANTHRTKQLLEGIIREDLNLKFLAFSRFEVAEDREMLKLLHRAGVRSLCMGFESLNNEALDSFGKEMNREFMEGAVKEIHAHGIQILASFIVGADPDTHEVCREIFRFVEKTRIDGFKVFPFWSLPAEELGANLSRLIVKDLRYFNGNHVVYFPKNIRPSVLQKEILQLHQRAVSGSHIARLLLQGRLQTGFQSYALRGRTKDPERIVSSYIPILEQAEKERYTTDDRLIE